MVLIISLPKEVFRKIASYLSHRERLICQHVCRQWYIIWVQYNYHCVHTHGKTQFRVFYHNNLLQSLCADQCSIGYQVRKLVIDNGHLEPGVLGQLPLLCPFLEVLIFDGVVLSEAARQEPFQHYQQRQHRQELDRVKHRFLIWKRVRQLVELNGITVTYALLQQPLSSLSYIYVQFNNQNDRTNCKLSLINSLHHAPRLVSLGIERIYLTVEGLEKIHASCPRLSSLKLVDLVLLSIMTTIVRRVDPAIDMRVFHFINGSFCDDVSSWLTYICEKYIFLRTLNIGSCHVSNQQTYDTQLLRIANKLNKLKMLNMQPFSLPKLFFPALDRNRTFLVEVALGNKNDSLQVIRQELADLVASRQKCTIRYLIVRDPGDVRLLCLLLGQCTLLTTLHLNMSTTNKESKEAAVFLDKILAQCPQLLSLIIENAPLQVTPSFTTTKKATGHALQSLKLDHVSIDKNVFIVVDTCCPHLTTLSLMATVPAFYDSSIFRVCLPHHQLHTLEMDRMRVSRRCSIRLGTARYKVTTQEKVVWYDLVGYDTTFSPQSNHFDATIPSMAPMYIKKLRVKKVKVAQYDEDQHGEHVAVVCKSLENLYLTGLQVLL
jgi:hypothetical protein